MKIFGLFFTYTKLGIFFIFTSFYILQIKIDYFITMIDKMMSFSFFSAEYLCVLWSINTWHNWQESFPQPSSWKVSRQPASLIFQMQISLQYLFIKMGIWKNNLLGQLNWEGWNLPLMVCKNHYELWIIKVT